MEINFLSAHQTMKIATKPRKAPEWTKTDAGIRAVLLRSFPKLREDSSVGRAQSKRAGVWMRFIQLYWRQSGTNNGGPGRDEFVEPGRITLRDLADEMNISLEAAKSLRTRITRAGIGVRCDGCGARRRASRANP